MDDSDFDPRSWRKKEPEKPANAPDTGASGPQNIEIPAETNLPEAWRGIGTSFLPGALADAPAPIRSRSLHAWAGSALILACATAGAWVTRLPPAELPGASAKKQAQVAVPGVIEKSLRLSGAEEIAQALTNLGVAPADAGSAAAAVGTILTKPGEIRLTAALMPVGKGFRLDRVQASYADGAGAVVTRDAAGAFVPAAVVADLTSTIKFTPGEIDAKSFYSSAVSAGVPDTLVPEFINAFAFDFNLASEVTPGDTFEVAYSQSVNANGEPVGQPELLYAKLTTAEKSLALYRFKSPDGKVGWYDGNGATTKRGFMRTPVDGARITSNFGMRFHPTLHYSRLHKGVDFGVPVGTPVYAAAAGVVIGSSPTGCGGNMAVVRHDNGWETRYFHLSHFAPGLHDGQRVEQGFTLGLSGTTGTCTTGPHLHYEVHIDGEAVDPLSVPSDDSKRESLQGAALAAFVAQRNRIDVARAQQGI
jgi:murein DD-endopeptidase MepM/ murein hydrolase activator NlpD